MFYAKSRTDERRWPVEGENPWKNEETVGEKRDDERKRKQREAKNLHTFRKEADRDDAWLERVTPNPLRAEVASKQKKDTFSPPSRLLKNMDELMITREEKRWDLLIWWRVLTVPLFWLIVCIVRIFGTDRSSWWIWVLRVSHRNVNYANPDFKRWHERLPVKYDKNWVKSTLR